MIFNHFFFNAEFMGITYQVNFSVVFFCLGFFSVDLALDLYGPKEASNFFYYKLFSQGIFIILGKISLCVLNLNHHVLNTIFNDSFFVLIFGLMSYGVCLNVMKNLLGLLKSNYRGKSIFKRYLYSTLPSEIIFSLMFTFLSFHQGNSTEDLIKIFISSSMIKLILTLIFSFTITVVFYASRMETEPKIKVNI